MSACGRCAPPGRHDHTKGRRYAQEDDGCGDCDGVRTRPRRVRIEHVELVRRQHVREGRLQSGFGGRRRGHGRSGRRREGGGPAERDHVARQLGQLRHDHEDLHRRSTASRSPAPTRTAPARTRSTPSSSSRARTARRTCSTSASRSRSARRRTGLLAPYKVATWDQIADAAKDPAGNWFSDYGGFVSIGYDPAKVSTPPDVVRRPRQAGVQEPGRHQRQPDPGGRGLRGGLRRRAGQRRHRSTTSSRASTTSRSSRRQATSCPSRARRPPCRAVRHRS